MCGIVVGLSFGKLSIKDEIVRQKLIRYFTTELMIETEDRGKDASGGVVLFNDGRYHGIKRGDKVTVWFAKFGETKDYWGSFLKVWRENENPSKVVLGHCRQGTHGDKEDNANNHPIKVGNIVGIHNGQFKNHDIIFENLGCKRDGKVDSEAVFRLFDHFTNGGKEPFTLDMCQQVVSRLDGEFAVVAFNADNLDQVPVFRDRRPVEFILLKRYGILLMISEHKFWTNVHFQYERLINYNPDLFGVKKMPSFLDKGEIESKELPDDHCMLFDLTKTVTMDSKIEDLGESKRMERLNKIWDTRYVKPFQAVTNTHTGAAVKTANQSSASAPTVNSWDKDKKRRVWDKTLGKYRAKIGDRIVNDENEIILDAKDVTVISEVSGNKTETSSLPTEPEAVLTAVPDEKTTGSPTYEDTTDYDAPVAAGSEDSKSVDDIIEAGNMIEVDMKEIPASVLESARVAYDALPMEKRGFRTEEDLLTELQFKDRDAAINCGMVVVASRAASNSWKQGYAACLMDLLEEPKGDKEVKREKHIAALKTLVVIMAKFYKSTKAGMKADSAAAVLASAAMDGNRFVKATELLPIFNTCDRGEVAEISRIISQADDYTKGK
jgi:hypothetical protein